MEDYTMRHALRRRRANAVQKCYRESDQELAMATRMQDTHPFLFTLIGRFILAVSLLVPLFFLPTDFPFGAPKAFLIIGAACVISALTAILFLRDRSYLSRLPKGAWLIGIYTLWTTFTSIMGTDTNASFWSSFSSGDGLLTFFAILIFAFSLHVVLSRKDIRCALAWTWGIGGVVVVASKYVGHALKLPLLDEGGTMGNSSFAAAYLIFSLLGLGYLVLTAEGKKRVLPAVCAGFILLSPLFLNVTSGLGEARAATLSIIAGAIAGSIFFLCQTSSKKSRTWGYVLAIAGIALTLLGIVMFQTPHSAVRNAFVEAASPTRLLYGGQALKAIGARPIAGWGWNSFPLIYQTYFDPINLTDTYAGEGWINKPHNLPLEIGASSGIVGIVLYLAFYAWLCGYIYRRVKNGMIERGVGTLFFGTFVAYFLQNLFLFEIPGASIFFWCAVAWVFSYEKKMPQQLKLESRRIKKIPFTAGIGITAFALTAFYFFAAAPAREAIALHNIRKVSVPERAEHIERIFALSPMGASTDEARFIDSYADLYLEKLPKYTTPEREIISNELAVYLLLLEKKETTNDFRLSLTASKISNVLAAYAPDSERVAAYASRAGAHADRAITLSPKNQLGYIERAKAAVQAKDMDTALTYMRAAVDLEPRVPALQKLLLDLTRATGEQTLFEKTLTAAKAALPDFAYPVK